MGHDFLRSARLGALLIPLVWVASACVKETVDACDDDPSRPGCDGAGDLDGGADGGPDGGVDGGTDAGPCPPCADPTPLCDPMSGACVACLSEAECADPTPFCVEGTCVECAGDVDCTDPANARCVDGTCGPCTDGAQCPEDLLCVTEAGDSRVGTCVECLPGDPADEATTCAGNSCDPASYTCTTTETESVRRCGPCVTDTECEEADDRCVEMFFESASVGGFCLKRAATGCLAPFTVPTPERESLSGTAAERYCGVDESTTSCGAVVDLIDSESCTVASDCGLPGLADGRCEAVSFVPERCTYSCMTNDECPTTRPCNDGYCGGQP